MAVVFYGNGLKESEENIEMISRWSWRSALTIISEGSALSAVRPASLHAQLSGGSMAEQAVGSLTGNNSGCEQCFVLGDLQSGAESGRRLTVAFEQPVSKFLRPLRSSQAASTFRSQARPACYRGMCRSMPPTTWLRALLAG